ncbi:MAG: putative peptidoglycan glycosyltransferase FtsW [Sphaerochaetaceae bacterium]|nr:putative peptidoglycan glycosyltransferase FtsW [Spirochaetales bacterium]MDY5500733.1 putative peptidoglycan glycosyltransferase FtsW [Sphaerochaetaceae bacterium]
MWEDDQWGEPNRVASLRHERRYGAFTFLCLVVFLTCFGLLMLYSSSYDEAIRHGLPHYYFFVHQLAFVVLSLFVGVLVYYMPIKLLRMLTLPMVAVSFLLMMLSLFTPLGVVVLGARRWIRLGPLSLQPSELVKVASIFFIADWYSKERKKIAHYLVPMAVMMLFAILILMQRDFSTTIVYLCLCLALQMAAGLHFSILILALAIIFVPGALAILTAPYRIQRMASFLFPGIDRSGASYQVDNALKAIRSGGLFGVGLGSGTYKLGILPEVQNDFIFASMCEELGLFWMLFLLALFLVFAILGYRSFVQMIRYDRFLGYVDFGLTTLIISQVVINVSVVTGLLPPTGIPLPFFSQGGTSLFVTLTSSAVLFRIMSELGKQPVPDEGRDMGKRVNFPTRNL